MKDEEKNVQTGVMRNSYAQFSLLVPIKIITTVNQNRPSFHSNYDSECEGTLKESVNMTSDEQISHNIQIV